MLSRSPQRLHIRKDKTNPRRLAYLTLLLFAEPPHWPLITIGAVLIVVAVLFHGWAAGYLARAGYAERAKVLTVRGPYRHTRNPYYLAQMTMDLGFFVLAGKPLWYLLYFPVIYSVYKRWVIKEERFLETEFGEAYLTLKQEVPRWSYRMRPVPARGSELNFQWSTFLLNRELPRSFFHLFLLTVFLSYFYLFNPFASMSVLARLTVIAAIAVWLALHDIHPLDASRKSLRWAFLGVSAATVTTIFLIRAPVWEPWLGAPAWISILMGLLLGLLVAATAFPGFFRAMGNVGIDVSSRPTTQWYVLGLGLGLLSCTLGGVWICIMVPFTMWAFGIAGLAPVKKLPQKVTVSLGLFLLFAFSGTLAVTRQLDYDERFSVCTIGNEAPLERFYQAGCQSPVLGGQKFVDQVRRRVETNARISAP